MSRIVSRAAVAVLALFATFAAAAPAVAAEPGMRVTASHALLTSDRTEVILVGTYACGPFPGGVPERGVIDLGVNQVVGGVEVRAIGYLEPTRCDGAAHGYATVLTAVPGQTLRRGPATWAASGYVEGGGGMQNVYVPPTPIRIR